MINTTLITRSIIYLANVTIWLAVMTFVTFILVPYANGLFIPDDYNASFKATNFADIVTRGVLYGMAIIEISGLALLLYFLNRLLFGIFSAPDPDKLARVIFFAQVICGSIIFILLAFVAQ